MSSASKEERRLGAIMFTDIVGYSAMAGRDEGATLALLADHKRLMEGVFSKYNGRVVKSTGDGFLVEFASAVEAVNCAVEAQMAMGKPGSGGDGKMSIRIGIHVGDVVHSGGDVLGDAVNVAARVQPLADPGGICVTRQVVDQVERKVPSRMVKMGMRDLKNIQYPVEVYKVEVSQASAEKKVQTMDPRRLAILPLANLSGDPEDRYFADGMTEELISTVSRIGELSVISRTSVMRYRDTTMPIGDIGRELSAGTVLEGSVRKAGNKVRITTQLIDATNDRHLWAQSYDRDLTDVFAIQGDIAEKVADALKVQLVGEVKKRFETEKTVDPEAYNLYLKGRYYWNERAPEPVKMAIKYFQQAIEKDPSFAPGYSGLADCYSILFDIRHLAASDALPKAKEYAMKSIELDSGLAEAHASLGLILENDFKFREAEKELRRALELRPNYSYAAHWLSFVLGELGRFDEGTAMEKKAYDLDPYSRPIGITYPMWLVREDKMVEAMKILDQVVELNPDYSGGWAFRGLMSASGGNPEGAIRDVEKAMSLHGGERTRDTAASVYAMAGRKEEAEKILRELVDDPDGLRSPSGVASAYFALGKVDEGFEWLNKAVDESDMRVSFFGFAPLERKFLQDPRWAKIEERLKTFR